jgi:hypothetical protein
MGQIRRSPPKLGRYYHRKSNASPWKIIYDPLSIGGFHKGAKFSEIEVLLMLLNKSFTLGTVLRHRQYGDFTVIESKDNNLPYKLIGKKYAGIVIQSGQKLNIIKINYG